MDQRGAFIFWVTHLEESSNLWLSQVLGSPGWIFGSRAHHFWLQSQWASPRMNKTYFRLGPIWLLPLELLHCQGKATHTHQLVLQICVHNMYMYINIYIYILYTCTDKNDIISRYIYVHSRLGIRSIICIYIYTYILYIFCKLLPRPLLLCSSDLPPKQMKDAHKFIATCPVGFCSSESFWLVSFFKFTLTLERRLKKGNSSEIMR